MAPFPTQSCDDQDPNNDQDTNNRLTEKRSHRHRHSTEHIQVMEKFAEGYPNPTTEQMQGLANSVGSELHQVKTWLRRQRPRMKLKHERDKHSQLSNEYAKLQAKSADYKIAIKNAVCPICSCPPSAPSAFGVMSIDEQKLRIQNSLLREENDRLSLAAAKYVGEPMFSYHPKLPPLGLGVSRFGASSGLSGEIPGAANFLGCQQVINELAVAAMEELIRMAQTGEPLWIPSAVSSREVLCEDEYMRTFPRGSGPKPLWLKSEASRESAVVIMNHINLVEILMDTNKWSSVFSSIVSRATTLEVLSTGVAGNYNGALQVMTAEFQVPSPLVPTREIYFLRYCKHHGDGTWAVVDVSLDNLRPGNMSTCRRRPSGCLIQELSNGYSKVTLIEHVEVDDSAVHGIYKALVNSGLAFGAKRWVAILGLQCHHRLACELEIDERKIMLKLAERMVMSFFNDAGASTAHKWTTLSGNGNDAVRIMSLKSMDDPIRSPGIVLSAAISLWLPVPPKRVFDLLHDKNLRPKWDILSSEHLLEEMVHIANGRDPGNAVSLLRVSNIDSGQSIMHLIQESCTDSTGSYVIYAPVDISSMKYVLSGGDQGILGLLPSGFAILPDGSDGQTGEIPGVGSGGSLLTVAFQMNFDPNPTAKLSEDNVTMAINLVNHTVSCIKGALGVCP